MINLIIITHGEMSKAILDLSKMVLGEFDYLSAITFQPGEGPDDLFRKSNEVIKSFDNNHGTLFLVDLFGGSPYNAASRIVIENENMDIVTGVNVPMLLELLDAREDISKVQQLVTIATDSGQAGIQLFSELFKISNEENHDLDELGDL